MFRFVFQSRDFPGTGGRAIADDLWPKKMTFAEKRPPIGGGLEHVWNIYGFLGVAAGAGLGAAGLAAAPAAGFAAGAPDTGFSVL